MDDDRRGWPHGCVFSRAPDAVGVLPVAGCLYHWKSARFNAGHPRDRAQPPSSETVSRRFWTIRFAMLVPQPRDAWG